MSDNDAAVEAAAEAIRDTVCTCEPPVPYVTCPVCDARAALSAARPHIEAEVRGAVVAELLAAAESFDRAASRDGLAITLTAAGGAAALREVAERMGAGS